MASLLLNIFMFSRYQKILLFVSLAAIFLLVYQPHKSYPYPFHVDEWHHITEAIRLANPTNYYHYLTLEPNRPNSGLEVGFHFFLYLISLVTDLVLSYKFLPAIWASFTGATLFYIVYKKTENNYWLAWLALFFFGSIKTNANLMGLWFFTPMTFSLPFILWYFYFFDKGIQTQTKKNLLLGLLILILLIPFHPLSVLFALPILSIYFLINYKFLIKEYKFFAIFLLPAIVGFVFYKLTHNLSILQTFKNIFGQLIFSHGWGVLELKNSPFELYNFIVYLFAFLGIYFIFQQKKQKEFSLFLIWSLYLILLILIYRFTGFSLFSPYQRNWYYLGLSLPILSAIGFYYTLIKIKNFNEHPQWANLSNFFILIISLITPFFLYGNYYKLPQNTDLYRVISRTDYKVLEYLKDLPRGTVMANPLISTAIFPVSGQETVGTIAFYGNRKDAENFYLSKSCAEKRRIVKKHRVYYVLTKNNLGCVFGTLLKEIGGTKIYKTNI